MKPATRLNQFPEYIFSRIQRKIAGVEKAAGRKVLDFGMGSPDIVPSGIYLRKLAEFSALPANHAYPGYGAIPEFSDAVISWFGSRFGVSISADELLPVLGAKDAVSHLPFALIEPGDEVLIPDPGYQGFAGPVIIAGGKPVYYDLPEENNFLPDVAQLALLVTEKTKCMWVNFPSNPTGQVATVSDLAPLVAFAHKHNIWLIYDNAYSEITFGGFVAPSILQVPGARDVAVEIGSFSKTFSFAGYRMGWIVGNGDLIAAFAKVKSQMDSGMPLFAQQLGAFALTHKDDDWHNAMIATYEKRRNEVADLLRQLRMGPVLPKGGLYFWTKIPDEYEDAEDFCDFVLSAHHIVCTPGTAFGKNGKRFIRVCFCVDTDRIGEYLKI